MTIGERVKYRRKQLGLTQEELAKRLGNSSRASVCTVEKDREDLTTTRIAKLAQALETTPAFLVGWVADPSPDYLESMKGQREEISNKSAIAEDYLNRPLKEALEARGLTPEQMEEAFSLYEKLISLSPGERTAFGTLLESRLPHV